MSKFLQLSLVLFIVVLESACASKSTTIDSDVMIDRLLHIDNEKFLFKTSEGGPFYNSLMEYREWESLYIKYSKYDSDDKTLTEVEMKKLLFIGYISRLNSDASISQSFSSDLVPIFNQNQSTILKVISDLKFLMPSTCYFLGNYFGFEDKNLEKKEGFLQINSPFIVKFLGEIDGEACLESIK